MQITRLYFSLATTALDIENLDAQAEAAYQRLKARVDGMPGELRSSSSWIPARFYYIALAALLALIALGWLGWRLVLWLRQ